MTDAHQPVDSRAIEERYLAIKERVWRTAQAHGREPASVKLVAVTKTFDGDAILPVLGQGHRAFGENRVQEAMHKWPALRERFPAIELHLIGPLQSNKAREAVALFDCIENSRPAEARRCARRGNPASGQGPEAAHPGQHGPRNAKGRRRARRCRFIRGAMPARVRPYRERLDVHPPLRRGPAATFRDAGGLARPALARRTQHGHERRFRASPSVPAPPWSASAPRFSAAAERIAACTMSFWTA